MKEDGRFLDEEMGFFKVEAPIESEDVLQGNAATKEESYSKSEFTEDIKQGELNEKVTATKSSLNQELKENIDYDESGTPTLKIIEKALELPCVAKVYAMTTCLSKPIIDKMLECDCVQKMMLEIGDKIPKSCRENFIRTVSVVDDLACELWDGTAQKFAFCNN